MKGDVVHRWADEVSNWEENKSIGRTFEVSRETWRTSLQLAGARGLTMITNIRIPSKR